MKISGIQKLTLIDYPKKIACTIFLFGCNFKCGFCHNPELVLKNDSPEFSQKEFLNFLKSRNDKLDGVCITGGEPLLTLEKNLLKQIKKLGYSIKLDTNGSFPEKLKELIEENLIDYIAMDIKTNKENYQKITNSNIDIKKIEESIKIIINSNKEYEFRTTIIENIHTEETMKKTGEWIKSLTNQKPKQYFLQGFKNQGKLLDNSFAKEKNTTKKHLEKLKDISKNYFEKVEIRE